MDALDLSKLSALVVDDFSSFRSTITGMLNKIGIQNIAEAARGRDALKLCKDRNYDLILCDYNLGAGLNGQQLLEELRYHSYIGRKSLFYMVTAEASKSLVLSAYDCEPDDYLMKPLNLRVLEQRITRLLRQRRALAEVYQLIEAEKPQAAVAALETLVTSPGKHQLAAQKLLGEQYLAIGDWRRAQRLYEQALASRQLDWAVLGMAKVMELKGERREAITSLERLTKDNRLFLPAYDQLIELHQKDGDLDAAQSELHRVTEVSPLSILRQRKLAQVANENGDILAALKASNEATKLGENSCYKDSQDNLAYLEALGHALEFNLIDVASDALVDSKKCLDDLVQKNRLSINDEARAKLLTARVMVLRGERDAAQVLVEAQISAPRGSGQASIDRDLAHYQYLCSIDEFEQANELVEQLLERHKDDEQVMAELDKLLLEPRCEQNRRRVAKLNKEGIDQYKQGIYDQALDYFYKATMMYPRHIGIQLNVLQTLVAKTKLFPDQRELQDQLRRQLRKTIALVGDDQSAHYARLQTLRDKAQSVLERPAS